MRPAGLRVSLAPAPLPTFRGHVLAQHRRSMPDDAAERKADAVAEGRAALPALDLRHVRIHHDAESDRAARAIGARAFTIGRDVGFRAGEHRPGTPEGDRLLRHELAHAARSEPGVVHRAPGEDARDSWRALVVRVDHGSKDPRKRELAQNAIRLLLGLPEGRRLVNELYALFAEGRRLRSEIRVEFIDDIPDGHGEAGDVDPAVPRAPRYRVRVEYDTGDDTHGGRWPDVKGVPNVDYTHQAPEAHMANTLHHELLHVWFLNAHERTRAVCVGEKCRPFPDTGHGDVQKGDIDPEFIGRLRAFSAELDAWETNARAAARAKREERKRQREAPQLRELAARTPPPEAQTPPSDAPLRGPDAPTGQDAPALGLAASFQGGVSLGRDGAGLAGILGADLILHRLADLQVGARGVYLTPRHLLAGGTLGMRFLQSEQDPFRPLGRVEDPLFFDLEAGVVAELAPSDARRLTRDVGLFAGAGVGQERGRDGARFTWRLGGFVIVGDRADLASGAGVAGGLTFGVGLRR